MNKNELMAKIAAMKNKTAQSAPADQTPAIYDNLKDMESAVKQGKTISLSNMADLVNKPKEQAPTAEQTPIEEPQTTGKKFKLVSFKVLWSEATSKYDNVEVSTWKAVNELMLNIGRCATMEYNSGYDKTKVQIVWEGGHTITDRLDLSLNTGDFNPFKMTVQDFLKPYNNVMYDSNLKEGDRQNILSWEDEETAPEPPQEIKQTNLTDIPDTLKKLIGIVETIEESKDNSKTALIQASEQVERCKAYITYLSAILPILEAKTNAMIEAKHKPQPIEIKQTVNHNLN